MTSRQILMAIGTLVATSTVADTIAWFHFDEYDAGRVIDKDTKTCVSNSIGGALLNAYATDGNSSNLNPDYMPRFADPVRGNTVYDPVGGSSARNRSSIQFHTANKVSTNAWYGGTLALGGSDETIAWPTEAITIECFVCTTGSTFYSLAPICGKTRVQSSQFAAEAVALYLTSNGKVSYRLQTSTSTTGGTNPTCATVNDGRWHHIAMTYSGSRAIVYVDYVPQYTNTVKGAIDYGTDAVRKGFYVGGYPVYWNQGCRKFDGCIDELRISNAALTPSQFLRLRDEKDDTVLRLRFDTQMGSQGAISTTCNFNDLNRTTDKACVYTAVTGGGVPTFAAGEKPADLVRSDLYSESDSNGGSISFETVDAKCGYLKASGITSAMNGEWLANNWATNVSYTVELAFKTRGTVDDATGQVLFQISSSQTCGAWLRTYSGKPTLTFLSNGKGEKKYYNWTAERVDDGQWHRVAVVNDAEKNRSFFYVDGKLAMASAVNFDNPMDKGSSLWVGCAYDGGVKKHFNGWIDDVRVTKRALQPDEFLNAQATAAESAETLAFFNFEDDFLSSVNADVVGAAVGEAHPTNGTATSFVPWTRGRLFLEGADEGGPKTANGKWLRFDNSVWGLENYSPLFEQKSFTVEFFGAFPDAVGSSGLIGYVPGVSGAYKTDTSPIWKLYRDGDANRLKLRLVIVDDERSREPTYPIFDMAGTTGPAGFHHYALVFDQTSVPGKLKITLCVDYATREDWHYEFDGYLDYAGYSDGGLCAGRLCIGQGGAANKLYGCVDALRFTRGVLGPDEFIHRERVGFRLLVR